MAAEQWGLITTSQVIEAGGTHAWLSRRVTAGLIAKVLPKTWALRGYPACWEQRAMASILWAGPGTALAHGSAARIWRLPHADEGPITMMTARNLKPATGWLIVKRVRSLTARDMASHHGFQVTTPSRTILDLGGVWKIDEVEDALDSALHRGLTSVARLKWQLDVAGGKGTRGSRALRQLLRERDPAYRPTHSVLETAFRRLLKKNGFPQPSQQHVVHRGPATKARVDFVLPLLRLAIEVDGYSSHGEQSAWQDDLDRQNDLVIAGLRVLRFTWHDVQRREERVVRKLQPFFGTQLSLSESGVERKGPSTAERDRG